MKSRILYIAPATEKPSGGAKALYDHVEILNNNNFNAFIVHNQSNYNYDWSNHRNIPTIYATPELKLRDDDTVVISEENLRFLKQATSTRARKIVFCQNHFYIFKTLKFEEYSSFLSVDNIIASSNQIKNFYEQIFKIPDIPLIPYSIPHEKFYPEQKKPIISYMPRKRPLESDFIKNLFMITSANNSLFTWKEIDMLNEESTASIMRESAIFLSLSRLEGFGLPPLEAMACGCLVVGFHGWGGLDFANKSNGLWCDEDNLVQCVEKLSLATDLVKTNSKTYSTIISNAVNTASRYTKDNQEEALISYFKTITY